MNQKTKKRGYDYGYPQKIFGFHKNKKATFTVNLKVLNRHNPQIQSHSVSALPGICDFNQFLGVLANKSF